MSNCLFNFDFYFIRQRNLLKGIAVFLFFFSIVPVMVYGDFDNEFIRLSIMLASISFTYWADLHWLIRLAGVISHVFVI